MKSLSVLGILAIVVIGLAPFGLSDTVISIADTSVPNNEVTSSEREVDASNSSATATITITMTTATHE